MPEITDKQLIGEIRKLRQIKPSQSWVSSVKRDILGEDRGFTFFPNVFLRSAFVPAIAIFMIVGLVGVSQNALPGDFLYPVKKMTENGQSIFVSDVNMPVFELKLASARLNDMTYAPAGNLGPTINEFQANVMDAAKKLSNIDASTSDPVLIKKIVAAAKKVEADKQKVESMGVVVGNEATTELKNALKIMADNLIVDLESRSLNEGKALVLSQMKELIEKGQYAESLELYLSNQ